MDNKYKISIIIAVIVLIGVIAFVSINESNDITNQLSPLGDDFDFSSEPVISWNEKTKEYSFKQNISSLNGTDYKDIGIRIIFYKDGRNIDNYTSTINQSQNGKFNLEFTSKLPQEPDEFYYDVYQASEV